jgi:hypothetical protein
VRLNRDARSRINKFNREISQWPSVTEHGTSNRKVGTQIQNGFQIYVIKPTVHETPRIREAEKRRVRAAPRLNRDEPRASKEARSEPPKRAIQLVQTKYYPR